MHRIPPSEIVKETFFTLRVEDACWNGKYIFSIVLRILPMYKILRVFIFSFEANNFSRILQFFVLKFTDKPLEQLSPSTGHRHTAHTTRLSFTMFLYFSYAAFVWIPEGYLLPQGHKTSHSYIFGEKKKYKTYSFQRFPSHPPFLSSS